MSITSTITYVDDYIESGNHAILSLANFYDTILVKNKNDSYFRTVVDDFFIQHRSDLEECIEWYSISEALYFKPKMLSLNLYGTTELWTSILRVNNMKSVSEFNIPLIKIYSPNRFLELINVFFKREGIYT